MIELRWRTPDPAAAATWLARLLGDAGPHGFSAANGRLSMAAGTDLRTADRLEIVDLAAPGEGRDDGLRIVAIGIATVDTERYALDAGWSVSPRAPDALLGASAVAVDGQPIVLLEPATEGRLAGTLARQGEGPVALYLRDPHHGLDQVRDAVRRRGGVVSSAGAGPFGREALVLGRPAWGPHLVVVDAAATIP